MSCKLILSNSISFFICVIFSLSFLNRAHSSNFDIFISDISSHSELIHFDTFSVTADKPISSFEITIESYGGLLAHPNLTDLLYLESIPESTFVAVTNLLNEPDQFFLEASFSQNLPAGTYEIVAIGFGDSSTGIHGIDISYVVNFTDGEVLVSGRNYTPFIPEPSSSTLLFFAGSSLFGLRKRS